MRTPEIKDSVLQDSPHFPNTQIPTSSPDCHLYFWLPISGAPGVLMIYLNGSQKSGKPQELVSIIKDMIKHTDNSQMEIPKSENTKCRSFCPVNVGCPTLLASEFFHQSGSSPDPVILWFLWRLCPSTGMLHHYLCLHSLYPEGCGWAEGWPSRMTSPRPEAI